MSTGTIPVVRCATTVNNASIVFGRKSHRYNVTAMATASSTTGRVSESRRERDYYKVLSLEHPMDVGAEEIKRAYRRLVLQHHPDVCPPSRRAESMELFLEVQRAYETLSDPARRVQYDAHLRTDGMQTTRPGVACARSVWESQLCVLRVRSEQRQRARSSRPKRPAV